MPSSIYSLVFPFVFTDFVRCMVQRQWARLYILRQHLSLETEMRSRPRHNRARHHKTKLIRLTRIILESFYIYLKSSLPINSGPGVGEMFPHRLQLSHGRYLEG